MNYKYKMKKNTAKHEKNDAERKKFKNKAKNT